MSENQRKTDNNYDEICGWTFVNLYTLCKEKDTLTISPFDIHNKEHLFILYMAKGLSHVYDKKLRLNVSLFELWRINRTIKDRACKIKKARKKTLHEAVSPEDLLNFMRCRAQALCGEEFTFGNIYDRFFDTSKKVDKK